MEVEIKKASKLPVILQKMRCQMKEMLIAPCGMNCSLCIAYQFKEKDLNKQGFHRKYCPGCIPRGKHCTHMGNRCDYVNVV